MNSKQRKGLRLALLSLIVVGFVSPIVVTPAEAARVEVRGTVGLRLPNGAVSITLGTEKYHYHRGTYYKKGKRGYVVVRAPRGAVIRDLPRGYSRIIVSGKVFYRFGSVYYRKGSRGYHVVDAPVVVGQTINAEEESVGLYADYESVWVGDDELLFRNGQFFRKTSDGLVWVEAPIGAVTKQLPSDWVSVWYEGIEYFESENVYFRKTPRGFRVVERPWSEEVAG